MIRQMTAYFNVALNINWSNKTFNEVLDSSIEFWKTNGRGLFPAWRKFTRYCYLLNPSSATVETRSFSKFRFLKYLQYMMNQ